MFIYFLLSLWFDIFLRYFLLKNIYNRIEVTEAKKEMIK